MTANPGQSVLVYDVGGSHVSAAVCQEHTFRLGPVVSAPHLAEQTSDAFIHLLYSLGFEASAGFDHISGAEIAMPGPFDFDTGVSLMRHKLPYLYGVSLRQLLAERFGWQAGQVRFVHDAAAFLLGEIGAGAARGVSRAVGITLGTGIGSAFAINGRVVTEGRGVPPGGEIWNLPYEGGIVEDLLSSRAIQLNYQRSTGLLPDVAKIAAAAASDPDLAAAFRLFGRHLGLALRMTLSPFAPDAVIVGGGISRSAHLFLPSAQKQLEDLAFRLQVAALFDHAPLVGAAVAWFNDSKGANDPFAQPAASATQADGIYLSTRK
jgi:glucokinase